MKKNIIIAALLTFCLTATIFMVATSNSAEYDPWVDLNDDGKIDIFDVVGMTSRYAATGDPTKNVTIAGHANKLAYNVTTQVSASDSFSSPWIPVDGYSKITICISTDTSENAYQLWTKHSAGPVFLVDGSVTSFGTYLVKTYDVPNEQIQVTFINNAASSRHLYLDVYLIP